MTQKRYPQIADDLRVRILSGELTPGTQLPVQTELQAEYRASTMTVRRALNELAKEGLVYSVDKVGVFVREEHRYVLELSDDDRMSEFTGTPVNLSDRLLAAYAADGLQLSQTLEISTIAPPTGVALRLRTNGDLVLLRHRVMYAGNKRIGIANTYVPERIATGTPLALPDSVEHDMISLLDQAGASTSEVDEEVFVRPATAEECREMGWPTGHHLLGQMFTAHTDRQEPVACWVSLMPSGRCILKRRRTGQPAVTSVRSVG